MQQMRCQRVPSGSYVLARSISRRVLSFLQCEQERGIMMASPTTSTRGGWLGRYFPIWAWLPAYQRSWLGLDVIAGLTVWVLVIPEAVAYAQIAGVRALRYLTPNHRRQHLLHRYHYRCDHSTYGSRRLGTLHCTGC